MPPPTQGLVSLQILGVLDRVLRDDMDPLGPEYVHACVEATKLAFAIRDKHITDPDYMDIDPQTLLARLCSTRWPSRFRCLRRLRGVAVSDRPTQYGSA